MGSYTPNFNLYKPDINETGWGNEVNQNFDTIDEELTANKILEKIKTVDGAGSGLDADTVDGKHASELGGTTGFEKVAEIEVSSNCTYVEFTNLDGNSDWFYVLFTTIKNPTGSGLGYNLFVNGETVETNYYNQWINIDGTSRCSDRENHPWAFFNEAGVKSFYEVIISKDSDGYFRYIGKGNRREGNNVMLTLTAGCKTATISNITSLRIQASVSNAIGAGSKFILFKVRRV